MLIFYTPSGFGVSKNYTPIFTPLSQPSDLIFTPLIFKIFAPATRFYIPEFYTPDRSALWEIVGQTQPPLFLCNKSSKSSGPPHPPPSFLKSKSSKSSGPPHPPPSFLKSKSSKSSGQYRLFFASEKSRVVRVVRVVEYPFLKGFCPYSPLKTQFFPRASRARVVE